MGRQGTADARRPAGRPSQGSRAGPQHLRKSVQGLCGLFLPRHILFCVKAELHYFIQRYTKIKITYQGLPGCLKHSCEK